jgi:nonsense-mediated mRNA decay protein 3
MPKPKNKGNNLKKFGSKKGGIKRKREDDDEETIEDTTANNVQQAPHQSKHKKKKLSYALDDSLCHVHIRQKVAHKRTFYYLEQLLLKHKIDQHCSSMKWEEVSNGLNATFEKAHEAQKFVDFVGNVVPVDMHQHTAKQNFSTKDNFKPNYSLEIAPICREDVVCLPQRLYNSMGNIGPIVLCIKVSSSLFFIDPQTLKLCEVPASYYFQKDKTFRALFTKSQLVEYTVLEVEKSDKKSKSGKYCLGDVQVSRTSDLGDGNAIVFTKCHFAHLLNAGDTVLGYDMKHANLNDETLQSYKNLSMPDVILVRKHFERPRKRYWQLKNTKMMSIDDDYDTFLDEIEEDEEMRKQINLYKNPTYQPTKEELDKMKNVPKVSLEELLDEMAI